MARHETEALISGWEGTMWAERMMPPVPILEDPALATPVEMGPRETGDDRWRCHPPAASSPGTGSTALSTIEIARSSS